MIEGCSLTDEQAKQIMKVCPLREQCVVKAIKGNCPGVRGACSEVVRILSIDRGEPLPPCKKTDAAARADQWWSDGSSVEVTGIITQSIKVGNEIAPPYGHTTIVMDLTTCSTGSPMPVDRVPERYLGHYVELKGIAMKGPNGWYIIAGQIDDME
jgi:hypothetical protein